MWSNDGGETSDFINKDFRQLTIMASKFPPSYDSVQIDGTAFIQFVKNNKRWKGEWVETINIDPFFSYKSDPTLKDKCSFVYNKPDTNEYTIVNIVKLVFPHVVILNDCLLC
tara:strand:+ start:852 stop:1187 length:336 start_codon:yes stop_codon:yes gene_type:complete